MNIRILRVNNESLKEKVQSDIIPKFIAKWHQLLQNWKEIQPVPCQLMDWTHFQIVYTKSMLGRYFTLVTILEQCCSWMAVMRISHCGLSVVLSILLILLKNTLIIIIINLWWITFSHNHLMPHLFPSVLCQHHVTNKNKNNYYSRFCLQSLKVGHQFNKISFKKEKTK